MRKQYLKVHKLLKSSSITHHIPNKWEKGFLCSMEADKMKEDKNITHFCMSLGLEFVLSQNIFRDSLSVLCFFFSQTR